jgi:hypothetical protein
MKFPVWQTVKDVFAFMWRERRTLMRFAPVPTISLFLVTMATQYITSTNGRGGTLIDIVSGAFEVVVFLPITVMWYRFVVLGPAETAGRPQMSFSRREWRLLSWQLAIVAITVVIAFACFAITQVLIDFADSRASMPIFFVGYIWTVAWFISILLMLTRLSMALVLVALDQPVSFKAAWHMTRGVAGRLFGAILMVGLGVVPVLLFFELAARGIGYFTMSADSQILSVSHALRVVGQTLSTLFMLLGSATLFGFVYMKLRDRTDAATDKITAEVAP